MSAPPPPSVPSPPPPSSTASDPAADSGDGDDSVSGSQSGGKKSSYYFFKSTPAHEAHKYMPTLITPGSATATASAPSPIAPSQSPPPSQSPEPAGGSRWNAAGTWEEKDLSAWAHSRLTTLLAFTSTTQPQLAVTCTKVTGDATLVFTRGKKRVGYDLNIACEWRGAAKAGGEEVKGAIELPSVDQTSGDDEYEMTVTVKERGAADDDAVDQLTRAAKKLRDTISSKIKQFEKELQEQ